MYEIIFLFALALIWIIFATVQDIKKKEIANWVNYSLIIFALGFRFFYSLFSNDYNFLTQGLIGFGIFFILGNLFYYLHVFAGGDCKLMISLGAILPIFDNVLSNLKLFLFFIGIFFVIGFLYNFFFIIYLSAKNFKVFTERFKKIFGENKKYLIPLTILSIIFLILGFVTYFSVLFAIYILFLSYLIIFVKAVDESCMIKKIHSRELTEGDWLYKEVKIGKKLIKPLWSGLTKEEILLIKKNKKETFVRRGIAFAPVFLISFILFVILLKIGFFKILFKLI